VGGEATPVSGFLLYTCRTSDSEGEFQSELQLSRIFCSCQRAERRGAKALPDRVEDRRVCQIERFCSQLEVAALGKQEAFLKAKVVGRHSGTANGTRTGIAESSRCLQREALRVEPVIG